MKIIKRIKKNKTRNLYAIIFSIQTGLLNYQMGMYKNIDDYLLKIREKNPQAELICKPSNEIFISQANIDLNNDKKPDIIFNYGALKFQTELTYLSPKYKKKGLEKIFQ